MVHLKWSSTVVWNSNVGCTSREFNSISNSAPNSTRRNHCHYKVISKSQRPATVGDFQPILFQGIVLWETSLCPADAPALSPGGRGPMVSANWGVDVGMGIVQVLVADVHEAVHPVLDMALSNRCFGWGHKH